MFLKQSTLQAVRFGPFLSSADGFTPQTSLTIAQANMEISKDGGAFAALGSGSSAVHDKDGWYSINLTINDVDTVGELKMKVMMTGTSTLPVWERWYVIEEDIYDALYGASAAGFDSNQRVDVGSWLGTAVTTSSTTNKPEVDVNSISDDATAANNLELDYDGTGYNKTNSTMGTVTTLTGHTPQTGDNFARLGAPAGASVSADIAAVQADTNNIQTRLPTSLVSGSMAADVRSILGRNVTETNPGDVANNFSQFYDVNPTTSKTVNDVGSGTGTSALTQQEVRDAMKLTPTAGAFASGSVDTIIRDILTDTTAILVDTNSLNDGAISQITGASDIPSTPTLQQAVMLLYMKERNNTQATTTERRILNDGGAEVLDATMSDNGTTFQQGKLGNP